MPRKERQAYNDYMKDYLRQERDRQRMMREQLRSNHKQMEKLQKEFPTAYELIFGKGSKQRRKP